MIEWDEKVEDFEWLWGLGTLHQIEAWNTGVEGDRYAPMHRVGMSNAQNVSGSGDLETLGSRKMYVIIYTVLYVYVHVHAYVVYV